jgi:hypothetical protein
VIGFANSAIRLRYADLGEILDTAEVISEMPRGTKRGLKKRTENPRVGGSIPPVATIQINVCADDMGDTFAVKGFAALSIRHVS